MSEDRSMGRKSSPGQKPSNGNGLFFWEKSIYRQIWLMSLREFRKQLHEQGFI